MTSTLTSSPDVILSVKNFSASYRVPYYQSRSFRDIFVAAVTSPLEFVLNSDDRVLLLDNISLTIRKGERLGILGNNGSGKTSFCRYISGIHRPKHAYNIQINGIVKGIFDTEAAIFAELSGRENLELLTHFFYPELDYLERQKIILDTEAFCELGKFLDVPFKLYSKGMKARLFLSLISSRPTDLLILDEVYNGADYFFNEKITKRIKKMIESSGAIIFVSHSNELIEEICNRVIVFKDKGIAFDGDTSQGIAFYKNHCSNIHF